jgi:hypothetical protein
MSADLRPEQFEDKIREAIDDTRLPVEAGRGIYHTKNPAPRADAIKVAKLSLEARKNRNGCEARCGIALLNGEITADLAERPGDRAIRILSAVPGDKCPSAHEPDRPERKHNAGRRFEGCR